MDSRNDLPATASLVSLSKKFYEEVQASPFFLRNAFLGTLADMGIETEVLSTSEAPQEPITSENATYDIVCDMKFLKRNAKGETPLQVAAKKKDLQSVRIMLRNNVNPNTQDNAGWTPLHEAVLDDNYEISLELLSVGAIVNVPAFDYTTPLHAAASRNNLSLVKLLLKFGADPRVRDIYGRKPDYYTTNSEIKSVIRDYSNGADFIEMAKIFQKKAAPRPIVIFLTEKNLISSEELSHLEHELNFRFSTKFDKNVTHVVTESDGNNVCEPTYDIMKAILQGCVLVNKQWLHACCTSNSMMIFTDFELNGTTKFPTSNGPRRARRNFLDLKPPLFTGCHIYLGKMKDSASIKDLVLFSGAEALNREPNPEHASTDHFLFHCSEGHPMENTSTLILYEEGPKEPTLKYKMEHIKTLPLSWFFDCIQTFEIHKPC